MKNIINSLNLEKILIKNWANFLDQKRLMAFALMCVRNHKFNNTINAKNEISPNIKISISQFKINKLGFNIWVEYNIPIEENIAIGTIELLLSNEGELKHLQTIGSLFK